MPKKTSATPLVAIDAVVLDTETTGLDPATARIVQVGAVRIRQGKLVANERFDVLVNPQIPIPPATVAVHHIDDAKVAGSPIFDDIRQDLEAFVDGAIIIGHSIGFDLAILRREYQRADEAWRQPRSLDTRLLAQIANHNLPDFSLDMIASWLGVDVTDRHTAVGDALATAAVFLSLIPKLRNEEIRTVAEAENACRKLTEVLDEHHRAGWDEPFVSPSQRDAESTLARIDSYPYRHRIRDVMTSPPLIASETMTIAETVRLMMDKRVSSLFLVGDDAIKQDRRETDEIGIVTERDILRTIAEDGDKALTRSVGEIMSMPVASVPADAFIYRAVGRMNRIGVRHLAVGDDEGRLVGALSARDLLRLRAGEAISLGDEIDVAEDVPHLAAAWATLPMVSASLVAEDIDGIDIAGVISRELGALTRRASVLAEERMADIGRGEAPCPYAVLVLGSAGRGESLMAADQDNAVVFAEGDPDGPEDRWFAEFGGHLADVLHDVGLPYCDGGVMARNPDWRGSLKTWQERIDDWVRRSRPQDLLNVDIFFDLRAVHGDAALARELMEEAYETGHSAPSFAKLLAESVSDFKPPLTFLGGFRTENGRVNLKRGGLMPIVASARVLAIRHKILHRATQHRLDSALALEIGGDSDLQHMKEAHGLILGHILRQQLADIDDGKPPSNSVQVKRLSRHDADELRHALSNLTHVGDLVRDLLFA